MRKKSSVDDTEVIHIRMESWMARRLYEIAKREGVSVSHVAGFVLRKHVVSNKEYARLMMRQAQIELMKWQDEFGRLEEQERVDI